jgi:hypothetical protein
MFNNFEKIQIGGEGAYEIILETQKSICIYIIYL